MKVTRTHIELSRKVNELQSSSYSVGTTDVVNERTGELFNVYRELADLPTSKFGQTPRRICSFTAELAALISVTDRPFARESYPGERSALVTAISEEAAGYLDAYAVAQYLATLESACEHNNLELPEGLVELRTKLQEQSGAEKLWS